MSNKILHVFVVVAAFGAFWSWNFLNIIFCFIIFSFIFFFVFHEMQSCKNANKMHHKEGWKPVLSNFFYCQLKNDMCVQRRKRKTKGSGQKSPTWNVAECNAIKIKKLRLCCWKKYNFVHWSLSQHSSHYMLE